MNNQQKDFHLVSATAYRDLKDVSNTMNSNLEVIRESMNNFSNKYETGQLEIRQNHQSLSDNALRGFSDIREQGLVTQFKLSNIQSGLEKFGEENRSGLECLKNQLNSSNTLLSNLNNSIVVGTNRVLEKGFMETNLNQDKMLETAANGFLMLNKQNEVINGKLGDVNACLTKYHGDQMDGFKSVHNNVNQHFDVMRKNHSETHAGLTHLIKNGEIVNANLDGIKKSIDLCSANNENGIKVLNENFQFVGNKTLVEIGRLNDKTANSDAKLETMNNSLKNLEHFTQQILIDDRKSREEEKRRQEEERKREAKEKEKRREKKEEEDRREKREREKEERERIKLEKEMQIKSEENKMKLMIFIAVVIIILAIIILKV